MQISSRFTIAVHILECIKYFEGRNAITSEFLSGSIGVNAVIIRRIISQLKAAGLVSVERGKTGIISARNLDDVTLYDVYSAVEAVSSDGLFHFHANPNPKCPVGKNIHDILDGTLREIQNSFEERMRSVKLKDLKPVTLDITE
ncbi:MAG: Rrf2 family transcriptional regulator [Synergistaceae bacterium]|nr:Rrf2 family transcriptional regulator [Synergistaceae bacterium]